MALWFMVVEASWLWLFIVVKVVSVGELGLWFNDVGIIMKVSC